MLQTSPHRHENDAGSDEAGQGDGQHDQGGFEEHGHAVASSNFS